MQLAAFGIFYPVDLMAVCLVWIDERSGVQLRLCFDWIDWIGLD